jgi:aspartate/methionine/tyrosine aminotransferase
VIWVMEQASQQGFVNGAPEWANLGQGEPEVGLLAGGCPRIEQFEIANDDDRYGPLNGTEALRTTISDYYNRLYRKGKRTQYSAENVSIAMGGRLALTRIFTLLGAIKLGYKIPDYPAYQDLMKFQSARIQSVCIPTDQANNHALLASEFEHAIKREGLNAFLMSNPCNPTGHVIQGEELKTFVALAQNYDCALILDEFYSHYIYQNGQGASGPVSSAAYVEEVNEDPVLIVDGLTKSFRYPGWRLAWILGPASVIADLGKAASAIDGGPSVPIQRAALPLFEPAHLAQESQALRATFGRKQNLMRAALLENGMHCSEDSHGTFYLWADISQLPPPLNHAQAFFHAALKHKIITVPGYMFDIRPAHKHKTFEFNHFIRFSFGPSEDNLIAGLERMRDFLQGQA